MRCYIVTLVLYSTEIWNVNTADLKLCLDRIIVAGKVVTRRLMLCKVSAHRTTVPVVTYIYIYFNNFANIITVTDWCRWAKYTNEEGLKWV